MSDSKRFYEVFPKVVPAKNGLLFFVSQLLLFFQQRNILSIYLLNRTPNEGVRLK